MRIAIVSTYYSHHMGYTENCLPAALARRGHDVHLIASRLNVYGNSPDYSRNYESFLGPAEVPIGVSTVDGYTLHRLDYRLIGGYVGLRGLRPLVRQLGPDVVHSTAVASLASYTLAGLRLTARFKFYTECHQHFSVVQPYLKTRSGHRIRRAFFWATRTLPGSVVGRASRRCYATAPDCAEVAVRLYGVPEDRIEIQSLGTDTALFRPATSDADSARRIRARRSLGYGDSDVVCLYTGRFSPEKNPLVLADAIDRLAGEGLPFRGLFVGDGAQAEEIRRRRGCQVIAFVPHSELAELYRMADIAAWPRQESMSMLDAAASGLPIVVSSSIGERSRIQGNGDFYEENNVGDLVRILMTMADRPTRLALGAAGRDLMQSNFSWDAIAAKLEAEYARSASTAGHR